ncbi:MAG: helix-hairpin-helix domain-containing protein [Gallionella sp.]
MKPQFITVALAAAVLLLNSGQSVAADNKMEAPQQAVKEAPKIVHNNTRHKVSANIKPVDINGATRKQLKTLPGIGDAEAGKIIAGRPYGSKADLVTHNIISLGVYESLKKRVVAKQSFKDAAKNAALYNKKK